MTKTLPLDAPVEVGKFYMVPCVYSGESVKSWWTPTKGGFVPVLGPEHEDAEFVKFDEFHYHIDLRFVPSTVYKNVDQGFIVHPIGLPLSTTYLGKRGDVGPVVMRKLQAKREMPVFPVKSASWIPALEAAHADCKLKPGNICPHRGIPLAPFADENGIAICPGHGLKWNLNTGELVRGIPAVAKQELIKEIA